MHVQETAGGGGLGDGGGGFAVGGGDGGVSVQSAHANERNDNHAHTHKGYSNMSVSIHTQNSRETQSTRRNKVVVQGFSLLGGGRTQKLRKGSCGGACIGNMETRRGEREWAALTGIILVAAVDGVVTCTRGDLADCKVVAPVCEVAIAAVVRVAVMVPR